MPSKSNMLTFPELSLYASMSTFALQRILLHCGYGSGCIKHLPITVAYSSREDLIEKKEIFPLSQLCQNFKCHSCNTWKSTTPLAVCDPPPALAHANAQNTRLLSKRKVTTSIWVKMYFFLQREGYPDALA